MCAGLLPTQTISITIFSNRNTNTGTPCTGPAIYQFQQVRQGFWEPLLICIGLAETYRVSLAWATPTGNGFNALKEEYNMGQLL